jgi:hypothetical protein
MFDGLAELDVALRHAGCDVAVLKKQQHAVKSSSMLFSVTPFCPLRTRARSSSSDKLPGSLSFGRKDRNRAIAVDVDEGVQESVDIVHQTVSLRIKASRSQPKLRSYFPA